MSQFSSRHRVPDQRGCVGFRRMSRRQAVQAGIFGALGLSLGNMLRLEARAEDAKTQAFSAAGGAQGKLPAKALSVIQLHLGGGVPQQESFDPKPEAPVEYRGSFGVTKTKHGDVFSDNFPMTAAIADKLTVIRSLVGRIPDHQQATYHLFTGYTPTAVIDYPQMGRSSRTNWATGASCHRTSRSPTTTASRGAPGS